MSARAAPGLDPKATIVLGLRPFLLPSRGLVDPHTDPAFAAALEAETQAHLGEPYDWEQIAEFARIGIEARFDPQAAKAAIGRARPLDIQAGHCGVCSVWTQARLEGAIARTYGLVLDLSAGAQVGHFNARPSDWQTFPAMQVVAGL